MAKIYKRPDQVQFNDGRDDVDVLDEDYQRAWGPAPDPFEKAPTQLTDYDYAVDYYLNSIDPTIVDSEGKTFDYGQGFIDSAYDNYDVEGGYKVPAEHYDYIHNKVDELINKKYKYLKPFYKRNV